MLLGLDHVAIAVRDLDRGSAEIGHALGLSFVSGGEHPEWGTRNAITRLGTDYLELIAVQRPEVARSNDRGRILLDYLSSREGGPLGFALTSDDLSRDTIEARNRGLPVEDPSPGYRCRPDGTVTRWRTTSVAEDIWGRFLPYLIQHETGMLQRRGWEQPEVNPLGAHAVHSVGVLVASLQEATERYRRLLGVPPDSVTTLAEQAVLRAQFCVESFRIELLQPSTPRSALAERLRLQGQGLFLITLAVDDVVAAVECLRARGTVVGDPTPQGLALLRDSAQSLGVVVQLLQGY